MRADSFRNEVTENIVMFFAEIGERQDKAVLEEKTKEFNRLFDVETKLIRELERRDGDQRSRLTSLFQHSNLRVRFNAAMATLAVAPVEARLVLQQLADWGLQPYSADAGMVLSRLDSGKFVPT